MLKKIEESINSFLRKYPKTKKIIKRIYQYVWYIVSPKEKSYGNIKRIVPYDEYEYFFGYYDKSPWNADERYMLCLRARCTFKDVSPKEEAEIVLIDTENNNKIQIIGKTKTWNVQQGCMLQWLGPEYKEKIIYNDFRNNKYCSVIYNIDTHEEKVIEEPVYSVAQNGKFALTLNFSRLYTLRPGYGYYNIEDTTKGINCPDEFCIKSVNLETGEIKGILTYKDFAKFEESDSMKNAIHKVNHIMINPEGTRFMVLHRWFNGDKKTTRLVTANIDGSDMYNLLDEGMISHCCWKNNNEILAWAHKEKIGNRYFLLKDKSKKYKTMWEKDLLSDGHPTYSPNSKYIITDSYADRKRICHISLMNSDNENVKEVARVFEPFKYDNDTRCDLHPRWDRKSEKICFDSAFDGKRALYTVDIENGFKKKIAYVFTSCKRTGPVQIMYNLISNIDRKKFEPILITIYDEINERSDLDKFLDLGITHLKIPLNKLDIIMNKTKRLKETLIKIQPDIIHSMGVFPDYAVSKMNFNCQVITLHNYMHDDYLAKFGKIKGTILEKLQMYSVKKACKVWTCSESLAKIYKEKKNLKFDYIRNGVDNSQYTMPKDIDEKEKIRQKLSLPSNKKIFVYTGQFIERKNQKFLLDMFTKREELKECVLLLLGDGVDFSKLKNEYSLYKNIIFTGNVNNVQEYLRASNYYISCSKSEGLPTSVLEAMSCGLPVILSNILQHEEILNINKKIGLSFQIGNGDDCLLKILGLINCDIQKLSKEAYDCAHSVFSAKAMSMNYQTEYLKIINAKNGGRK